MNAHTLLVSFHQPMSATELDQFLAGIEQRILDTGLTQSATARRYLPTADTAALIIQFTPISTSALAGTRTAHVSHEPEGDRSGTDQPSIRPRR